MHRSWLFSKITAEVSAATKYIESLTCHVYFVPVKIYYQTYSVLSFPVFATISTVAWQLHPIIIQDSADNIRYEMSPEYFYFVSKLRNRSIYFAKGFDVLYSLFGHILTRDHGRPSLFLTKYHKHRNPLYPLMLPQPCHNSDRCPVDSKGFVQNVKNSLIGYIAIFNDKRFSIHLRRNCMQIVYVHDVTNGYIA